MPTAAATKPQHIFIIVLENEGFFTTFGPSSPARYLSQTLTAQGELLANYYGTGHFSNDNYVAMVSGQAPDSDNQGDCINYTDFVGAPTLDSNGQAVGNGCVYPTIVQTIADQLDAKGLTWGGFMEDMGNDPTRESSTCAHPSLNSPDNTQTAESSDQYATRHNPFVYFHSIIDSPLCASNVVPLSQLSAVLQNVSTTPNYVFITPNLCDDGHDAPCKDGRPGGLVSADQFLKTWVPAITSSPAYQQDGMLLIVFDEAEASETNPGATDATSCCNEMAGPNSPQPGIFGMGGGKTGAVILSQFVQPGSVNNNPYNHYALLRSIEDLFGLDHLGFAAQAGLNAFGPDVYNAGATPTPGSGSAPSITPTPSATSTSPMSATPTASPTPTPAPIGVNKINHIIIAMQENHSFDNYFGALPYAMLNGNPGPYHAPPIPSASATPACDPSDHQCVDGLTCARASDGTYSCSNSNIDCIVADPTTGDCTGGSTTVFAFHDKNYCVAPDLDHGWTSSHREMNFSSPNSTAMPSPNDGFVRINDLTEQTETGEAADDDDTLGFYNEDDLPFYYALAETFAINDRYFCDVIGPTTPNRFYFVAGTSFGHIVTSGEELPPNGSVYQPITGTIYDLMNIAGVTWKDYFSDLPAAGDFVNPTTNPTHFASISQFISDAQAGTLPAVSFVDPALAGESNLATDEHPPHDIRSGEAYMSQIINALCYAPGTTSGPCNGVSWKDSILFITYDEHGGAYDHVTPPLAAQSGALTPEAGHIGIDGQTVAPAIPPGECADRSSAAAETPGSGQNCANSSSEAPNLCPGATSTGPYPASCANFNQLGFRVPFIAVSPFARQGYVSHTVGDHTSLLALIEKRFLSGKSLTNRDANANDLEDMFDFTSNGPSVAVDVSKLPAAPAPNLQTDGNGSCAPASSPTATPTPTP
jgi:phospholipase C